ncbi:MAG: enoyl-CoA hydratase-related protein [Allosphingosinicella sp.]|uniref:enoyl-CoA hydratase-related protein n=1 Tax=Allosphingosinicella sp. TaxID=2823234 RepID=UPI0039639033
MSDQQPAVAIAIDEGIATLTLNRPDKLNALSRPMIGEIVEALNRLEADDEVRAVIFTGAGRAFCAGADLAAAGAATFDYEHRAGSFYEEGDEPVERDWGGILTLRLFAFAKPLIAAVNGAAVGVGATMQLPMDIRIASTTARFGFVFARIGIVPEAASSWFLPRIVGISTALEWCYSGRLVSAEEALDRGLVRSLHHPEALLADAHALARELTSDSAPVSIALTRQMMWRMLAAGDPRAAHELDSRAVFLRGQSADAREGVAAFLQKRKATFPDRVSRDLPDIFG